MHFHWLELLSEADAVPLQGLQFSSLHLRHLVTDLLTVDITLLFGLSDGSDYIFGLLLLGCYFLQSIDHLSPFGSQLLEAPLTLLDCEFLANKLLIEFIKHSQHASETLALQDRDFTLATLQIPNTFTHFFCLLPQLLSCRLYHYPLAL